MSKFEPKFNSEKWDEYFKDPVTSLKTPYGNVTFRKEFVRCILMDIKDAVVGEFDCLEIAYMNEGRGKSNFTLQKEYMRWFYLKELGLIEYDWTSEVIYGSLDSLMYDLLKYINVPYRQFVLDEADELKRNNWQQKAVKRFISYLRRGRKFLKFIHLNLPNLKDLPEDIVVTRANRLYELGMSRDLETIKFIRGHVKMFEIPRADKCYSFFHKKTLAEMYVKNTISGYFQDAKRKYIKLPNTILCLDINFNKTFPLDKEEYKKKMATMTENFFKESYAKTLTPTECKAIQMIHHYLTERKILAEIFIDDSSAYRTYYNLYKAICKILELKVEA